LLLLLILIPSYPPLIQHWSYHTGFQYFCKVIQKPLKIEICILAGGLSRRMGRDKARLLFGGRTLLAHIKRAAESTGLRVRVIRRDTVPRCGPLGGIYTAMTRGGPDRVLFLACDMPLISTALLLWLLKKPGNTFLQGSEGSGFPFVLEKTTLPIVSDQIQRGQFSLQQLARRLGAKSIRPPIAMRRQLRNLNTPVDWVALKNGNSTRPAA
jgi:molybdopterin-guanine dinucleotide biosynthesis protein A